MPLQHSNLSTEVDCIPCTILTWWLLFSLFPLETRGARGMRGRSRCESGCASSAVGALPAWVWMCRGAPQQTATEEWLWHCRYTVGWGQVGYDLHRALHTRVHQHRVCTADLMFTCVSSAQSWRQGSCSDINCLGDKNHLVFLHMKSHWGMLLPWLWGLCLSMLQAGASEKWKEITGTYSFSITPPLT